MIDDNRNDENKINESTDFNVIRKLADSLADDITEMKTETPAESPKPSEPSEEADPALQNISEEAVAAVEEPIPVPESPDAEREHGLLQQKLDSASGDHHGG